MPKVMNKDGSLVPLAKTIYKSNPHYWADSGVGYVFCGFCKKSFPAWVDEEDDFILINSKIHHACPHCGKINLTIG